MTLVSYLLVAHKSNDALADALHSIQQQTGDFERELIIIDNYEAENCREVVLNIVPHATVVINKKNEGYTHATNQSISLAKGSHLFLLNPDVKLAPDCTRLLLSELEADSQLAAAAPQLLNPDGSIQSSVRNFPTFATLIYEHAGLAKLCWRSRRFGHWKNRFFDHQTRSLVEQPMTSALLIKRDVLDQVGALDERFFVFFSDVDLCHRIKDAGYRILFSPLAKADHVLGGSTRKEGSWLIYDSHRGFYRYLAKHQLRGWRVILRPLAAIILSVSAVLRVIYRKAISSTSL